VRDQTEFRTVESKKEAYISFLSHELRNPLQVIVATTDLLLRFF
jgi:signal transduction histidine kinase